MNWTFALHLALLPALPPADPAPLFRRVRLVEQKQGAAGTLPVPRLEVALRDPPGNAGDLQGQDVTGVGRVLLIQHGAVLVALDRTTGQELWRRKPEEIPDPSGTVVKGTRLGVRIYQSVAATGTAEGAGPIVLLSVSKTVITEDRTSGNGVHFTTSDREEAVQAETGTVLWHSEWQMFTNTPRPYFRVQMRGDLIFDGPASLFEFRPRGGRFRVREAKAGRVLDLNDAHDRNMIQKIAAESPRGPLLLPYGAAVFAFRLETGEVTPLLPASDYTAGPIAFFPAQQRIVRYLNADDDGAGHSLWPLYVVCHDEKGQSCWGLPRVVVRPTSSEEVSKYHGQSITRMVPCRAAGSVLCVDDKWRLLDVRDGHPLWTGAAPRLWTAEVAEAGKGFLILKARGDGRSSLAWMEGRTGTFRWISTIPTPMKMQLIDGDVLLWYDTAHLKIYSLAKLTDGSKF